MPQPNFMLNRFKLIDSFAINNNVRFVFGAIKQILLAILVDFSAMRLEPLFQVERIFQLELAIWMEMRILRNRPRYRTSCFALLRGEKLFDNWNKLNSKIVAIKPPLKQRLGRIVYKIPTIIFT